MTEHISDDLPRLLTGDATRKIVLDAATHLRTCADCQQELVSAVVAHASLTSAHRFAPEVVALDIEPHKEDLTADPVPLPDLSGMFDQVRKEAAAPSPVVPGRRRLFLVAAAAAVVISGGTAVALVETSGGSTPASHTVALSGTNVRATATIVGSNRMKIDATSLPALDAQHQYEVWMTNPKQAGGQLQAVGLLGTDNRADLTISPKLANYQGIAVSTQEVGQVQYSGVTVLRGTITI